ncbi:hypothetical protein JZ785_04665 [Alicyclobacillus curvatus]|nr:hypothetical protein JZ785_04665 [Alicyclobacillus curvatus]
MIPLTNLPALKSNNGGRATSKPNRTQIVTLERGNLTIRLTCNEPLTTALETFRSALREILNQMIESDMPPVQCPTKVVARQS